MCHWRGDKRYNIIGGSYVLKFLQLSIDQNFGSLPSINKHSINTWLTLHWHLGWQLAEAQLIFDGCIHIWVRQHMAGYWPIVDLMMLWVHLEMLIKCWVSVDRVLIRMSMECQDVDQVPMEGINRYLTVDAFTYTWSWLGIKCLVPETQISLTEVSFFRIIYLHSCSASQILFNKFCFWIPLLPTLGVVN